MLRKSLVAFVVILSASAASAASDALQLFETKVRPVLAAQCYACHSKNKVAGLRVDSREDLIRGGDSGAALIPGDPDKSLLVRVIRHEGDVKMPKGGKLKAEEIQAIADWVKAGAPWPAAATRKEEKAGFSITPEQRKFWSYQPLGKFDPPAVKDTKWPKTGIDRFILAKLEAEGLKPVAAADKRTLIRRLTYDLTGLPPSPEEVEAFVKDSSPDAYSRLIDRLLGSQAYGERWGRHWLDVARFGEDDTRGLAPMGRGHEPYAFAYHYRDWVIRAMNDDMPYDQFVKAQLAADQMDEKVRAKMLPALGFLGQGPWYYDLVEPPIARADERNERVDVVTRGFLGMTVACARCHDHKYDPISMKDYYGIAGVFNSTVYHEYAMVPKSVEESYKRQEKRIKDMQTAMMEFSSAASQQLAEILARKSVTYMMAAYKAGGPDKEQPEAVAAREKLDLELLQRWIRFLAKPPAFYPYLKDWQQMMKRGGDEKEARKLAEDFQNLLMSIVAEKNEIKKKNERMIAKGTPDEEVKSVILPNGFMSFFDKHQLELKALDREKMNLWTDVFQREMDDSPDNMVDFRRMKPGLLVFRDWGLERRLSPEWNSHIAEMRAEIEKARKELQPIPIVHGVAEAKEPANLKIHLRGSPYNLGEEVPRRFLEILSDGEPKPFSKGSGRMELAEAIAASPITARVIVNRVWKWHFGTGIVDTPSNFGFGGERPTHPELIDYLARFFLDNGQSLKKLHKEILMSATYQLSVAHSDANVQKDAANRLYWRANRQRLDAEQIRDSLLSYSGKLDRKMYGPSEELKDDNHRRAVYGKVSRFRLDTYFQLFDFPNPNISAEKRHVTNVPLQRLFFLNSPFILQQAEAFSKRLAGERTDEAKIRKAYRILYQRDVTAPELQAGLEFLNAERKRQQETDRAKDAPKVITEKSPAEETPQKAADTGWFAPDENGASTKEKAPEPASGAAAKPEKLRPAEEKMAPAKKGEKMPEPVDPWTLYAKVLLGSNELLYIQ
jgi:hypothetical protein